VHEYKPEQMDIKVKMEKQEAVFAVTIVISCCRVAVRRPRPPASDFDPVDLCPSLRSGVLAVTLCIQFDQPSVQH
jgi:hypothetical protein